MSQALWRRRALRIGFASLIAIGLFALLGFLVVPPIAKWQIQARLGALLDREVTVEGVAFNPFTLTADVRGLVVADREQSKPLFGFDVLTVDLSIASITRRGVVIAAIKLVKPQASIIRLDANRYNFSDLVEKFNVPHAPPPTAGTPFRFAVANIELADGRIDFDDRPEQTKHEVTAIKVGVPFVSNFPIDIETKVEPLFGATVNGDPFAFSGESRPFKETRETTLRLKLNDVDLPKYLEYVPADLNFKIPAAKLDGELLLRYAQPSNAPMVLTIEGEAALTQLSVTDKTGLSLVSFDALKVGLKRLDLSANAIAISSVELLGPRLSIRRDAAGRWNLSDLVPRLQANQATDPDRTKPAAEKRPFQLEIASIAARDGHVEFTDESNSRGFKTQIDGLALQVEGFSLAPDAKAKYTVQLHTDLGVSANSSGSFSISPLVAEGRIELAKVRVADYAPYFEQALVVDIPLGWASAGGQYQFRSSEGATRFALTGIDGSIESLSIVQRADKAEIVGIGKLDLTGIDVDISERSIAIAGLAGTNVKVLAQRSAEGSINFANLGASDPARASERPANAQAASPWRYSIKKGVLDRSAVRFTDASTTPPADIAFDAVQISLDGLSSAKGSRANARLRTAVNKTGSLSTNGWFTIDPFAIELALDVAQVDSIPFEPYFSPYLNVSLASGNLSTKGRLSLAKPASGPLKGQFNGDVTVADLASTDKPTGQDLLKWGSLVLGQVGIAFDPMVVRIGEVALANFYSRLIITQEGQLNLQSVIAKRDPAPGAAAPSTGNPADQVAAVNASREPAPSSSTEPAPTSSKEPAPAPSEPSANPRISIGRITLQSGEINFTDLFVKPNYSADVTHITGAVSEITPEKAGNVDMQGRLDKSGSVEIVGQVNPFAKDLFVDVKADARDIDLPTITPYAAKYVGYAIEKGKLTFKAAYRVESGQLTADNNVILDQLTFGERVESPSALNVPIALAVALLKDRNGVIDINLPISGSLNDPEFSLGGIIATVITNLIVKAATSPFALLSAAFGSSGEDLGYVEYEAGLATLSAEAEGKLKTLSKALIDRPALRLDIAGRTDAALDREGLRRAKLIDRMRTLKLKDLSRTTSRPPTLQSITIEPAEYSRWLTQVYRAADFQRPRNAIGILRDLPVPEMEAMVLANTPVTDDDLRQLALQRAQHAKDYLVDTGQIPPERIFIVSTKADADDANDKGKPTRASFVLK
ncbi:MAG: DUF748 domain-containing protein [Burkholderiales bacterium]